MIRKLFIRVLTACSFIIPVGLVAQENPVEANFPYLIENHEVNHYPYFDGITCAVVVLNSLKNENIESSGLGDKTLITQENIFNPHILSIATPEYIEKNGVAIDQLVQIFQFYGLKAKASYPTVMTEEALREMVQSTLKSPNSMMIVNYDQGCTSLKKGITYGVVIGYDIKSDAVWVLKVNENSKSKEWIKTKDLLKGMQSLDENHTPHGLIIIEKPQE